MKKQTIETDITAVAENFATDPSHDMWLNLTAPNAMLAGRTLAVTALALTNTGGNIALNPAAPNDAYRTPNLAFAALSAGETATDSFIHIISDGRGSNSNATASVTITSVNHVPRCRRGCGGNRLAA